jgi:peptide deformylase
MPQKIVQNGDLVLRTPAKVIPTAEIDSKKVKRVIADMKKALTKEPDGVAIAAPQIGESLRIFVVAGRVFALRADEKDPERFMNQKLYPDKVFINPQIIKRSKKEKELLEGCLSVRHIYGKIKRSEKATVKAQSEDGKIFTQTGSGLLAEIFQHETDHLDGILFIDKAKDLRELHPENDDCHHERNE